MLFYHWYVRTIQHDLKAPVRQQVCVLEPLRSRWEGLGKIRAEAARGGTEVDTVQVDLPRARVCARAHVQVGERACVC